MATHQLEYTPGSTDPPSWALKPNSSGVVIQSVCADAVQTRNTTTALGDLVWDDSGALTLQANTKHLLWLNGLVYTTGSGNGWRIKLVTSATIDFASGWLNMDIGSAAAQKSFSALNTEIINTSAVGATSIGWAIFAHIYVGSTGGDLTIQFSNELATSTFEVGLSKVAASLIY